MFQVVSHWTVNKFIIINGYFHGRHRHCGTAVPSKRGTLGRTKAVLGHDFTCALEQTRDGNVQEMAKVNSYIFPLPFVIFDKPVTIPASVTQTSRHVT